MAQKSKYRIKEGKEFRPFGPSSLITDETLTDSIVEWYTEKDPEGAKEIFEEVKQKNQNK